MGFSWTRENFPLYSSTMTRMCVYNGISFQLSTLGIPNKYDVVVQLLLSTVFPIAQMGLSEYYQELMSATKRREGVSNYQTLFVPPSVESRALNFG